MINFLINILKLCVVLMIFSSLLYAKTWDQVAKVTASNLKGHKILYNKGFYVISSSKKAFEYFDKHTVETSRDVWKRIFTNITNNTNEFVKDIKDNPALAKKVYAELEKMRKEGIKLIKSKSEKVIDLEWKLAKESFEKSWNGVLKGTILLKKRTQEDRLRLIQIPKGYFSKLKADFSNVKETLSFLKSKHKNVDKIKWTESFDKAASEFNKEYLKSSKSSNSLTGLGHIIMGYLKGLYFGLIKPSGKTTIKSGRLIKKGIEKLILLPVGAVVVSGRTIYSLGGVVYYSSKIGVDIISPYLESAFHGAVALISVSSIAPSYVGGKTLGALGQVALKGTSIAGSGTSYTLVTVGETAKYVGNVLYDFTKKSGEVVIGAATSGVVLGYNAVTSLPSHIVMGAINAVFFLVYDGPKLSIAMMRGDIDGAKKLPVGSVIDIKEMEKRGIKIEIISDDPKLIDKVIKSIPRDLESKQ